MARSSFLRSLESAVGQSGRRFYALVSLTLVLCLVGATLGPMAVDKLISARTFLAFGNLVSQVDTREKIIALTFDDGPDRNADDILALLDSVDVKATFYVNGANIAQYPQRTRRIVESGHELGNHTYTHRALVGVSYNTIEKEITETDNLIRGAGYYGPLTFRPAYGRKGLLLPYYLGMHNRTTVMWSVHAEIFAPNVRQSAQEIVDYTVGHAFPGAIIILHPWFEREHIRQAIVPIVRQLKAQGYEFVTISELQRRAGQGGVSP